MKQELSAKTFSDGIEKIQCMFGPITKEKAAIYYKTLNFIPDDLFAVICSRIVSEYDKPYFPFPAKFIQIYEDIKPRQFTHY